VPARRKFLKSARTEQYHIEEVIRNQSLAHERTAFSLVVDNRTILDLPGVEDVSQRVRDVFRNRAQHLLTIDVITGNDKDLHIRGFLLPPEFSSSRTSRLRILVNGRPVQDRMVRHAVMEGMRGFLMKGQSPAGVLFLDLPARQVDVNVHPAKQEVRFRRSGDVHTSIVQATATAIRAYQDRVRSDLFTVLPSFVAENSGVEPSGFSVPETGQERVFEKIPVPSGHVSSSQGISAEPPAEFHVLPHAAGSTSDHVPEQGGTVFSGLTLVGQLFQLYLLCERDGQFVVIDQHAAHERILYQQLSSAYHERKIPRQSLLFPVTVEVAHEQAETLGEHEEDIRRLGFIVDHFGDETWVIKSVPALVKNSDPAELLLESLDILRSSGGRKAGGLAAPIDDLLASMACRAAVKAGDTLAPEEMLELLAQMQSSEYFSHCPHGRPVVKVFSRREIEKWFHRV
jgi:DNA mismatch repair protein MutL